MCLFLTPSIENVTNYLETTGPESCNQSSLDFRKKSAEIDNRAIIL